MDTKWDLRIKAYYTKQHDIAYTKDKLVFVFQLQTSLSFTKNTKCITTYWPV